MSDSTLEPGVLCKYVNPVFVETGTARGEGVQVALHVGFQQIYTIEVNPHVFIEACERFAGNPQVICLLGDSKTVLPDMLRGISQRCTFWLDAHWSTGEPELADQFSRCPVLDDIAALERHPIKCHTILIDDMRYFHHGIAQWYNIKTSDIIDALRMVNPNYQFHYEDGHVKDDILVASIE